MSARCPVPGCGAPMDGRNCTAHLAREHARKQARRHLNGGDVPPAAGDDLADRIRRVLDSAYGYATAEERLVAVDALVTRAGYPAQSGGAR